MATNTVSALAFCKKCNADHEKPVGNKCERTRNVTKEDKPDLSRETVAVKKTPKGNTSD